MKNILPQCNVFTLITSQSTRIAEMLPVFEALCLRYKDPYYEKYL